MKRIGLQEPSRGDVMELFNSLHAAHHTFNRRNFLRGVGLAGAAWMTPLGHLLAREAEKAGTSDAAQSVILL